MDRLIALAEMAGGGGLPAGGGEPGSMLRRRRLQGLSFIEMAVAIVIIGILLAAGLGHLRAMRENNSLKAEVDQLYGALQMARELARSSVHFTTSQSSPSPAGTSIPADFRRYRWRVVQGDRVHREGDLGGVGRVRLRTSGDADLEPPAGSSFVGIYLASEDGVAMGEPVATVIFRPDGTPYGQGATLSFENSRQGWRLEVARNGNIKNPSPYRP